MLKTFCSHSFPVKFKISPENRALNVIYFCSFLLIEIIICKLNWFLDLLPFEELHGPEWAKMDCENSVDCSNLHTIFVDQHSVFQSQQHLHLFQRNSWLLWRLGNRS